ncbi:MAG: carbohydrate ABC transporter permease [Vallitalea sp.]|jgi:raffinose/stachyose/melibiose transport system permease protein|nr:carbohydrate ABC transporter permease [Vallitalea sp.]
MINRRNSSTKKINNVIKYLLLIAYTAICILPIYFALMASFKTNTEIFSAPFALPKSFNFSNYINAWREAKIGKYFLNSIILTGSVVVIVGFLGSMASYILARFEFKWKKGMYLLFIMGMMIPLQSTMIPLAFNIGKFGLKDNFIALILVSSAYSISMTVFILTGFMKAIPNALEESAIIDGCNLFQVFTKIIIPISMPAVATASIFNFLNTWNNLLFPLLFISDNDKMPISYGLLAFRGEKVGDFGGLMAAIITTIIPPLLAYVILQEKVEKGLTAGAVKG